MSDNPTKNGAAERGKKERKDWLDYLAAYHFVYVRTMKRTGCRVFKKRTARGKEQLNRIWVRRYPYLFTKEFRRTFRKGAVTR